MRSPCILYIASRRLNWSGFAGAAEGRGSVSFAGGKGLPQLGFDGWRFE
jgi:hypothetical protein